MLVKLKSNIMEYVQKILMKYVSEGFIPQFWGY